ncbi:hypothetical protein GINT2_000038 [Glugoides intestinalis]
MLSEATGKDLLDEIKHDDFKRFNTSEVQRVEQELAQIHAKIEDIKRIAELEEITDELSVNFALLKSYKDRLERILRAYRFFRLIKIQDNHFQQKSMASSICSYEQEFLEGFVTISDTYLKEFHHLLLSDRHPPLNFFVQILALEDCGAIMCGDDFIDLKKDRIYFLKKSDVTHLLKRKLVKII